MSRLDDAARSVPADPSTASDDALETQPDPNLDADAAGEAADGEDGQDGKNERTAENVRGELLRKMQKSNQEMMAELKALREQVSTQPAPVAPAPETPSQPQTLDDMTVDQLIQMQPNVPEEQKAAFDAYLMDRKVDAKVDARLSKFQSTTEHQQAEEKHNATAFDRWPQLRNKQSEFYGITDQILSEMGPSGESNPRAVLEAANEAGLQLGLAPASGVQRTRRKPGNVAPGRSTRGTSAPEPGQSEAQAEIANRLQNAMPGKKFTKEQLKRIAKRSKMYEESINSHVRG